MDISDRIKERMQALGLKGVDISKATGVSSGGVSQWVNGMTKPRGEKLIALARVLDCEPDWLLFGEQKPSKKTTSSNVTYGPDIKGYFPLISWVQAGAWSTIEEISISEATRYPCPVKCSEDSFVLKVQGVSMEPVFRDGDLIFVDPQVEWRHGSYIVARLDDKNEATFKQLIIEGGQKFLKPANPNWPEQIIPVNGNCTIVGVVVFSGRSFS
ncbi:helix-turn-helix domain-containing protein [Photobacterium sanctipauli]|uniref:Helix-turn-helix domain-containing protein n=1 Tax=Photobacterium sanctipauli TaxID=1342794 RepID=A0A2T3NIF1_9GAMM|nr:S24 family peptidase [Photobacterium sanctipauli]PSW14760.1 helix-turn-helix domain-containing protein [Photobacterium sanctipauli]